MYAFPWVGFVHCSQDPQVPLSANITSNLDPTTLLTHLKIILLQYFQFSVFSNKWYPNRPFTSHFSELKLWAHN